MDVRENFFKPRELNENKLQIPREKLEILPYCSFYFFNAQIGVNLLTFTVSHVVMLH